MTYALDEAFSAPIAGRRREGHRPRRRRRRTSPPGHDIGTPERDIHKSFPRVATTWWEHADKTGAEAIFVREQELYLGMCRRWRELPKPTIAMVQGACIAGGLMLAWVVRSHRRRGRRVLRRSGRKHGHPRRRVLRAPVRHARAPSPRSSSSSATSMSAERALRRRAWSTASSRAARLREETLAIAARIARCLASALALPRRPSTRPRTAWVCATRWTRRSRCTTSRTLTTP